VSERTFCTIKPDAVRGGRIGEILTRIEAAEFKIVALQMRTLTRKQAELFYDVHRQRPFFSSLCDFMSSGPCVTMVLEAPNAVLGLRTLMGATDPASAKPGTIRADFGGSVENNAIHGSDGSDTAKVEIAYFFPGIELVGAG
jgi:nucleoside-diphosphate kinase